MTNDQNVIFTLQSSLVLNFEHWDFDIVSDSDFGFRYSDFTCLFYLFQKGYVAKIDYETFETRK